MDHCSVQVCWFPCSESHTQISCWRNQKQDLVKSDLYVWSPVRNVTGDKRTHAQINPPKNCIIYTLRPCLSSVDCILGQWPVQNIPKFKDRASWSCDTFQPMRRRACVYQQTNQNIAPVLKNFQNNGRSRRTELKMSLQYSSGFHI